MKKRLVPLAVILVLSSALAVSASGETAQDVLAKMINAMGGRKAVEAAKDTTVTGNVEMIQMGMSATVTMYQKEPNKMRMDIEVMGMVITQAYDGKIAWFTNPQTGSTEEMPEAQAKEFSRQAMGNDSFLNPDKWGITYVLKDKETFDGKTYIVVEQTLSDSHKNTIYLDPETYLTYKTKTMALNQAGVEVLSETILGDYRKEGDLMFAHSMTVNQDGAEFMKMTMTKIVMNTGLEDSLFAMSK